MTDYIHAETKGTPGAPLVFTFHGTGADETQFHGLAEQLFPRAHVVSPRGDVSEHGMARYFRRTGEGVYDMADLAQRHEAMAQFIRAKLRDIGAPRVIALGYSNGANIAAAVAFAHPDVFTDVIAMHPLIPWTPEDQPGPFPTVDDSPGELLAIDRMPWPEVRRGIARDLPSAPVSERRDAA